MDRVFSERAAAGLVWLPEVGMGYYPVRSADMPYDAAYFERYQRQAGTEIGRQLTEARVDLVARHYTGELLDVGIGCGQFVQARLSTLGYDVNPAGVEWLKARDLYRDLYAGQVRAASFWDALEHIPDPGAAVAQVLEWVFVSLPVYESAAHVLRSKHFRKDEHLWYHEDRGIKWWFAEQGFECVEATDVESQIGRDGIMSYVFRRC